MVAKKKAKKKVAKKEPDSRKARAERLQKYQETITALEAEAMELVLLDDYEAAAPIYKKIAWLSSLKGMTRGSAASHTRQWMDVKTGKKIANSAATQLAQKAKKARGKK